MNKRQKIISLHEYAADMHFKRIPSAPCEVQAEGKMQSTKVGGGEVIENARKTRHPSCVVKC